MEAFSRSGDMILNACRNCGCNPFSYDPLRSKQMTTEEVLVKQQIVETGIKPIYSYSEYLLCPVVPFESRILDDKHFRFLERTTVRKCALHTACHFGEWEVVSVLTNAILGDSIVTPSQRGRDSTHLVFSDKTRAEILRLCLIHVKYMEEMTPELASFTAPTPDHKPAQSNDPSDLKGQRRFQEQKEQGERKLDIIGRMSSTLSSIIKKERKTKKSSKKKKMKVGKGIVVKLMNIRGIKTNDELEKVLREIGKREKGEESDYDKLSVDELKIMIKTCKTLIKETKKELLMYDIDHGKCFSCFAFLLCMKIENMDGASDIEKLKRWRYAECRRRLAPLKR